MNNRSRQTAIRRYATDSSVFDEILAMDPETAASYGQGHVSSCGNGAVQNQIMNVFGNLYEAPGVPICAPTTQQPPLWARLIGMSSLVIVGLVLFFFSCLIWTAYKRMDGDRHYKMFDGLSLITIIQDWNTVYS
jgi:hypothetical protein